jgi:hypothetical protein
VHALQACNRLDPEYYVDDDEEDEDEDEDEEDGWAMREGEG